MIVLAIIGIMALIAVFLSVSITPIPAFVTYFTWLTFEDFIRKMLGNDMKIYFVKHLLLGVILIHLLREYREENQPLPRLLVAPLWVWGGIVFVNCFNPSLSTPVLSFLGIHGDLLYLAILLPAGYRLLRSSREVIILLTVLTLLIVGPTIAGIAQQFLGPSFLNEWIAQRTKLRPMLFRSIPGLEGKMMQVSSIFVDPGRYARMALISLWVSIASAFLFLGFSRKLAAWAAVAIALSVVSAMFAGARFTLAVSGIALSFLLIVAFFTHLRGRAQDRAWMFSQLAWLLPVVAIAFTFLYFLVPSSILNASEWFTRTLLGTEGTQSEIVRRLPGYVDSFELIPKGGLLGFGTGSRSLGSQYVAMLGFSKMSLPGEQGFAVTAMQYGVIGLAIRLWLLGAMLVALGQSMSVARTPNVYWFIAIIFGYAASYFTMAQFLGGQHMQDYLMQSYLWFIIGMTLRMPALFEPVYEQNWGET